MRNIKVQEFDPENVYESIMIDRRGEITVWDSKEGCTLDIEHPDNIHTFYIDLDDLEEIVKQARTWYNSREARKGTMP